MVIKRIAKSNNQWYALISLIFGFILNSAFYPISFFPSVITIGMFSIILKSIVQKRVLFLCGSFFGYGFFIIQTYWIPFAIYKTTIDIKWIVPLLSFVIPIPFALIIGLLAIITQHNKYGNVMYSINFAFLWVIFEYIRSNLLIPFPWGLLGYSSISMPFFNHTLSYVGSYGTSFFIVLLSCSLFSKNRSFIILNIMIFSCVCAIGKIKEAKYTKLNHDAIVKIRLIQPNIQQPHYGNSKEQKNILDILLKLTLLSGFHSTQYIFWPEASFPYPIFQNSPWLNVLKNFIPINNFNQSALILGIDRIKEVSGKLLYFNSMISLEHQNKVEYYDKRTLVPFGEYIPYKKHLTFLNKIAYSVSIDNISKGKNINTMNLNDHMNFIPLICFESILDPGYLSLSSHKNYQFILILSNDSWFENTTGPYQHFMIARVKAIEYGLPVIRVSNTGISAIISPYGNIIKIAPMNKQVTLDGNLPLRLKDHTLYYKVRHYIVPSIFMLYIIFLITIFTLKKKRHV